MQNDRRFFQLRHFALKHYRSTMKAGTDAIILGAWAPVESKTKKILDVGTGCGILALMMAQKAKAKILAIDIDENSIIEADENFKASSWSDRLCARNISLQLLSKSGNNKFDFIISNPPFFQNCLLPSNEGFKKAKHNMHLSFDSFVSCAMQLLDEGGKIAVILPAESVHNFLILAEKERLFPERKLIIYPAEHKKSNRCAMVLSKNSMAEVISSELVIRKIDGDYTEDYKRLTHDFHAPGYL
jgi:tRNA1Val (adenine37-N6)-methyltransferase